MSLMLLIQDQIRPKSLGVLEMKYYKSRFSCQLSVGLYILVVFRTSRVLRIRNIIRN